MQADIQPRPEGRPTKYRPQMCADIIEWGRKGFSLFSFPAFLYDKYPELGFVHRDTVVGWLERHPEFSYAAKISDALAQKLYEEVGLNGITGNLRRVKMEVLDENGRVVRREYEATTFAQGAWAFAMKNRWGWRDRHDINLAEGKNAPTSFAELVRQSLGEPEPEAGDEGAEE